MYSKFRSHIILTENEDLVLKLLLKNLTTSQIAEATHLSKATVNAARRSLLNKFEAKTNLQLIVITILDDAYFQQLGEITYAPADLTQIERDTIILAIQGLKNIEIAKKLGISLRTVEYKKKKFSSGSNVQFVKRAIEMGVLVVLPVKYYFRFIEVFGATIKVHSLDRFSSYAPSSLKNINSNGFIYFDYLHRFTLIHTSLFGNSEKAFFDIVTSMKLSGIDDELISEFFPDKRTLITNVLNSLNHTFSEKSLNLIFKELLNQGNIELIKKDNNQIDIYTQGQKLLMNYIAQGTSKAEIVKMMKIRPHQYDQQLEIIKTLWNAPNLLSVYLTFLHLNFLQVENKS